MIKLPVVDKGITLTEIPDHLTVFFEIGGCKCKCKGCHSPHLNTPICKDLYTSIVDMRTYAESQKAKGATAIVLMGGTNNYGVTIEKLIGAIKELSKVLPVGVYSGLPCGASASFVLKDIEELQWLKIGDYKEDLGGLDSPTTNQKFFARSPLGFWENKTHLFRKE